MWLLLSGDDGTVSGEPEYRRMLDRVGFGCRLGATTCSGGPKAVRRRKTAIRRKCSVCGLMRSDGCHPALFGRCGRCRLKVYCGIACQRYDWIVYGHKFACERWEDGESEDITKL